MIPVNSGPTQCYKDIVRSCKELESPVNTKVSGSVPSWLNGCLMRSGAGEWDLTDNNGKTETVRHWFDGHALVHRFNIRDGEVTYFNKFLRSEVYKKNNKYKRFIHGGFGTPALHSDPCLNLYQRFFSYFQQPPQPDNCNVNIWPIGDKTYAFTETCAVREIDPLTLESEDLKDISHFVTVNQATAHPHTDTDGTVYNMGSTYGKKTFYNIIKYPVNNNNPCFDQMEIVASIPADNSRQPGYYHSFGITENYFLFLELPYRLNIMKILFRNKSKESPSDCLCFLDDVPAIFKIVCKKTKQVLDLRVNAKGMGVFHFGNAFEVVSDGTTYIVWDACVNYGGKGAAHLFNIDNLRSSKEDIEKAFKQGGRNDIMRFVFPLSTPNSSDVKSGFDLNLKFTNFKTTAKAVLQEDGSIFVEPEELLSPEDKKLVGFYGFEFPRYNYALNGRKYRYLYGCGFGEVFPDRLVKIDTITKETKIWYEKEIFPSEPVFVQNPNNKEDEDNGVILSICVSTNKESPIFLLILDGKTFTEICRAKTEVFGVPYGFHHTFLPHK